MTGCADVRRNVDKGEEKEGKMDNLRQTRKAGCKNLFLAEEVVIEWRKTLESSLDHLR